MNRVGDDEVRIAILEAMKREGWTPLDELLKARVLRGRSTRTRDMLFTMQMQELTVERHSVRDDYRLTPLGAKVRRTLRDLDRTQRALRRASRRRPSPGGRAPSPGVGGPR